MSNDVLLVGKPGPLSNALINLIESVPTAHAVFQAETGLLALKMMRVIRVRLVVIASSIADDETTELVSQIQAHFATICLVIANTPQQIEHARQIGAQVSVLSTISATELKRVIQQQLTTVPQSVQEISECPN